MGPDQPPAAPAAVEALLHAHVQKDVLRFTTCGSVDDGKSTLLGRLLYEAGALFDDQLDALARDSARPAAGGTLDFASLFDGLQAEREQGITIDVAYRFFTTAKRKFIVGDSPGHEQYTRNMVTAASTADVAIVLVDARKGLLTQSRRHTTVLALLGIRHVALAVNKLDLVGWSREVFDRIESAYRAFAGRLGLDAVQAIPLSALHGDNVTAASGHTPWYGGPTLLQYLESVAPDQDGRRAGPFRMLVQRVTRSGDFRGYAGRILGGSIRERDRICVLPSGKEAAVRRIVMADGDLARAAFPQSVTVTLTEDLDIGRGDMLCDAVHRPLVADQFEAHIIWMGEEPLVPGRHYGLKLGARWTGATLAPPKHKINVDTFERTAARTLALNEIGVCNVTVDEALVFDAYKENRDTGGFIIADRETHHTVGAGLVRFALRRSQNLYWQSVEVNKAAHSALKGHRPALVWLTGLSGAGKSTIANLVEKKLHALGCHTTMLDGDNIRHGLSKDLGFTEADRIENIRRVAEVGRLMVDAGLITLVSFISPFRAEREMARRLVGPGEFCEAFVDVPLEVAERRDPKGLYRKARRGELVNFTGIDSPYEPPQDPEVHVDTTRCTPAEAAERIVDYLREAGILRRP